MSRGPDAATLIERALLASAERAACPVSLADSEMKRWASATFTGARHRITLVGAASPAVDAWLAELAEADLALRGHLVADIQVVHVRRAGEAVTAVVEALTVEER